MFKTSLTQYAKHRGVSLAAVQRAIKDSRLTEGRGFVIYNKDRERPTYRVDIDKADKEWSEKTVLNGVNAHSIAGNCDNFKEQESFDDPIEEKQESPVEKLIPVKKEHQKIKAVPVPEESRESIEKENAQQSHDDSDQKKQLIPTISQSKQLEAYYNTQLKRVKLDAEREKLIEYSVVETVLKNMVIKFKQQILATNQKFKTLMDKDSAELVRKELDKILVQLSNTTFNDYRGDLEDEQE